MGVFVIVALARGQAWLGASLVGTVCTVSAEPSLSSYTINFFFLIWKGWGEGGGKESVSPMLENGPQGIGEAVVCEGSGLFIPQHFPLSPLLSISLASEISLCEPVSD